MSRFSVYFIFYKCSFFFFFYTCCFEIWIPVIINLRVFQKPKTVRDGKHTCIRISVGNHLKDSRRREHYCVAFDAFNATRNAQKKKKRRKIIIIIIITTTIDDVKIMQLLWVVVTIGAARVHGYRTR